MKPKTRRLLRNLFIELIIYSVLLLLYVLFVLRFLSEPLHQLFNQRLVSYAIATLVLIVTQGVVLDFITTFLMERLDLEKSEH